MPVAMTSAANGQPHELASVEDLKCQLEFVRTFSAGAQEICQQRTNVPASELFSRSVRSVIISSVIAGSLDPRFGCLVQRPNPTDDSRWPPQPARSFVWDIYRQADFRGVLSPWSISELQSPRSDLGVRRVAARSDGQGWRRPSRSDSSRLAPPSYTTTRDATGCPTRADLAPEFATALVSATGYSSFSGEWQAGSRPILRRLTPSYRHVFALAQLAPGIH
jgi:hypothetical protein